MAGSGKTWIAKSITDRLYKEIGESVFFIDCGITQDLKNILYELARRVAPNLLYLPPIELSRALRYILYTNESWIVLDNLQSEQLSYRGSQELLTTFAGTKTKLILTSRDKRLRDLILQLDSVMLTVDLDRAPISNDISLRLLQERLGTNYVEEHKARLLDLCRILGNHPLALIAATRILADTPFRGPEFLIQELLQNSPLQLLTGWGNESSIKSLLLLSYESLSTEDRLIFPILSIFNGHFFSSDMLAAILERPEEAIKNILSTYEERSLITFVGDKYWTIHPLFSALAKDERLKKGLADDLSKTVIRGAAKYYIRQYAENPHPELDHTEKNLANVLGIIERCQELDEPNLVCQLVKAVLPSTLTEGHWDIVVFLCNIGVEASRQAINPIDEANFLLHLGAIWSNWDHVRARELLTVSIKLCQTLDWRLGLAKALIQLGIIYTHYGEYCIDEAQIYFSQSLRLAEQLGDAATQAEALCHFANQLYKDQGDYNQATKLLDRALMLAHKAGDSLIRAQALRYYGEVDVARGHIERAAEYVRESLALEQSMAHKAGVATSQRMLALIDIQDGKAEEASRLLQEALSIDKQLRNYSGVTRSLYQLGRVFLVQGLYDEAHEALMQALSLSEQLGLRETDEIQNLVLSISKDTTRSEDDATRAFLDEQFKKPSGRNDG